MVYGGVAINIPTRNQRVNQPEKNQNKIERRKRNKKDGSIVSRWNAPRPFSRISTRSVIQCCGQRVGHQIKSNASSSSLWSSPFSLPCRRQRPHIVHPSIRPSAFFFSRHLCSSLQHSLRYGRYDDAPSP